MSGEKRRLVVGVSGASGAPLALACLEELRRHPEWEVHLIVSAGAAETLRWESSRSLEEMKALAHTCYETGNIGAGPASGTFRTEGMLIVPCSMKTVAGICCGYADNLLLRAADVTIKEGRPLVLVARESPLSAIHLRNLAELSRIPGVTILPPMMTFYNRRATIEEMTHHLVCKMLERFGIQPNGFRRWTGDAGEEV
ncbi:MAG TPA: UbiX family flavin prenyltransferase [Candidatus Flavonifractor merdavium]|nr:UbiX family flavin prenyltransferase [Candidatus Flavonifractor merdavium]